MDSAPGARKPAPLESQGYLVEMIEPRALRWRLLPFGTFRTAWDVFILLLVIYTAVVLPFDLLVLPAGTPMPPIMDAFEILIDLTFLFDIALNARDQRIALETFASRCPTGTAAALTPTFCSLPWHRVCSANVLYSISGQCSSTRATSTRASSSCTSGD